MVDQSQRMQYAGWARSTLDAGWACGTLDNFGSRHEKLSFWLHEELWAKETWSPTLDKYIRNSEAKVLPHAVLYEKSLLRILHAELPAVCNEHACWVWGCFCCQNWNTLGFLMWTHSLHINEEQEQMCQLWKFSAHNLSKCYVEQNLEKVVGFKSIKILIWLSGYLRFF